MSMGETHRIFSDNIKALACPLCGGGFAMQGGSLRCANGHCYDIAAKGYVNFVPQHVRAGYAVQLFRDRRAVFEAGFYDVLADALTSLVVEHAGRHCRALDAGCGEGFFARRLQDALGDACHVLAVDIEKEAVRMAAGGKKDICWMVGDLANLPVGDCSQDILLNILSPANYAEFRRVLKPGGILLKVVPGSAYLQEVRAAIAEEASKTAPSGTEVTKHFEENMQLIEKVHIAETKVVTQAQAALFFGMTPLSRNADIDQANIASIKAITIDLDILVGRK